MSYNGIAAAPSGFSVANSDMIYTTPAGQQFTPRTALVGLPPNMGPDTSYMIDPFINDGGRGTDAIPSAETMVLQGQQGQNTGVVLYTQEQVNAMVNERLRAEQLKLSMAQSIVATAFTPFQPGDQLSGEVETVTAGIWSDNISSLTTHFSSSAQTATQRRYYVDVLQDLPSADGAAIQYSIAFGHAFGSGSDSQGQLNDSPSRAIYSQYRRLLLAPGANRFVTQGSGSTDYVYVINIKRNRLKERLDEGNFELPLRALGSHDTNATGSVAMNVNNKVITLIDDSSINTTAARTESGRVYNIVSGSIANGVFNSNAPIYYGLVYPDHGIMVLDGKMLDQQLNFGTILASSTEGNNHFLLYRSISGSCVLTNAANDNFGFLARNSEKITSSHYFIRIKNSQYNFSNNPTYVTGSVGAFSQPSFVNDPKTYITTIGLYDNKQQLLAVAKLSKPLLKSFTRESLIRVKLDF